MYDTRECLMHHCRNKKPITGYPPQSLARLREAADAETFLLDMAGTDTGESAPMLFVKHEPTPED